MSAIFGGSKSKQQSKSTSVSNAQNSNASWNDAYPYVKDQFGGMASNGAQASDFIRSLLGMGGSSAASAAYDQYKDSAGYRHTMDSGMDAVTGTAAGRGMLQSGATLKGLQEHGQKTGQLYFNNYLDKLMGTAQQGLGAGSLIAGAGAKSYGQGTSTASSNSTSSGSSSSKPGIAAFIGQMASAAAASDRRLKKDIIRIGRLDNGLNVYSYKYLDGRAMIGVMADEVEKIQPEALGPVIDGYATVDYSKVEGWNR